MDVESAKYYTKRVISNIVKANLSNKVKFLINRISSGSPFRASYPPNEPKNNVQDVYFEYNPADSYAYFQLNGPIAFTADEEGIKGDINYIFSMKIPLFCISHMTPKKVVESKIKKMYSLVDSILEESSCDVTITMQNAKAGKYAPFEKVAVAWIEFSITDKLEKTLFVPGPTDFNADDTGPLSSLNSVLRYYNLTYPNRNEYPVDRSTPIFGFYNISDRDQKPKSPYLFYIPIEHVEGPWKVDIKEYIKQDDKYKKTFNPMYNIGENRTLDDLINISSFSDNKKEDCGVLKNQLFQKTTSNLTYHNYTLHDKSGLKVLLDGPKMGKRLLSPASPVNNRYDLIASSGVFVCINKGFRTFSVEKTTNKERFRQLTMEKLALILKNVSLFSNKTEEDGE